MAPRNRLAILTDLCETEQYFYRNQAGKEKNAYTSGYEHPGHTVRHPETVESVESCWSISMKFDVHDGLKTIRVIRTS